MQAGKFLHAGKEWQNAESLPDQELLDRARKQSNGASAVRDRKRRQCFQERNFAEAATEHGFKRARWRGLVKQTIQDQIIAALQNLNILIRKAVFTSAGLITSIKKLSVLLSHAISMRISNFATTCPLHESKFP